MVVLAAVSAFSTDKRRLSWRELNWPALWMTASPLAVLLLIRSTHAGYAYVAVLGVYLLVLFPLRRGRRVAANRRPLLVPLALVLAVSFLVSLVQLGRVAQQRDPARPAAAQVVRAIRTCEKLPCRVGITYVGSLSASVVANLLIYEEGVRARLLSGQGLPEGAEFVLDGSLPFDERLGWECHDLLIVLAEPSWLLQAGTPFRQWWPRWAALSGSALRSADFEPLGGAIRLRPWEQTIVLRRKPRAAACEGQ
jgi:hypothetical protein